MKFRWDRKYLYWGVTAFCVIACSMLFFWTFTQWSQVKSIVKTGLSILNPIITGVVIAYILNPILSFLERKLLLKLGGKLFPKNADSARHFSRIMGIMIVVALLISIISTLLILVLPQLYLSIQKLVLNMQAYYNTAVNWLGGVFNRNVEAGTLFANILSGATNYFTNWVNTGLLPRMQNIIASLSTGVIGVIKAIFGFFIGIIVSCYVMYRKEEFTARIKKLTYSLLSKEHTDSLINAMGHIHKTFGQFFVGKLIDATFVGIVCATFMTICKLPYVALISMIIATTNVIPFFGPYIGGIPSCFLILLESPVQCVIFGAFLIIMQAFDGNVVEPRIIGNKTGMSGFWIIFSILLFGGIFGFPGLLFGVPLFAVIYSSLGAWSKKRLKNKQMPTDTAAYIYAGPVDPAKPEHEDDLEEKIDEKGVIK